ncbi:hypothetical protein [Nocardia asteroides]|uniref:hypothetical protein n=1 Tax=Nocardia asteroides TaxID=1824 RepID=UPI0033EEE34D
MWGLQRRDDDADQGKLPPAADALTVQDIIDRIAGEDADAGRPSPVLDHSAPRGPLTIEKAHTLMQRHRACSLTECAAKREGYLHLVEQRVISPCPPAGHLDTGVIRG